MKEYTAGFTIFPSVRPPPVAYWEFPHSVTLLDCAVADLLVWLALRCCSLPTDLWEA